MPRVSSKRPSAAEVAFIEAQVAAKPEPDPIVEKVEWKDVPAEPVVQVASIIPAPAFVPAHALEELPKGKIVVSRNDDGKVVRLLHPGGDMVLPKSDICYQLPTGCKIQKVGLGVYEGYRLGVSGAPAFVAGSVADAVSQFLRLSE